MNYSNQQEQALAAIKKWLKSDQQVFRLFGYAGSGKTTLAKEIASMSKEPVFAAFTGKAASVMRRKGCVGAETIHSLIYKVTQYQGIVEFKLKPYRDSMAGMASLIIIDECSMVDERIGKDLLSFGTKILVLGDPAQLPPIEGQGFFTSQEPDFMLTEVHRQAEENPIIRLSMKARLGEPIECGQYGESRVITRADINAAAVLESDQVIVGLNRTRQMYNARIRQLLDMPRAIPVEGDRLICLRNDRSIGVFNGSIWNVEKIRPDPGRRGAFEINLSSTDEPNGDHKQVTVLKNFFDGTESKLDWQDKKGTQEFAFGYAITCHKSQGSEWDNVIVFDESSAFRDNASRWLYTSITRSASKLTLVVSN